MNILLRMQKLTGARQGFTIAESLVSILLLFIVITAGMGFYSNSSDIMAMAMHKKIAMEIANENMEVLRNLGFGNLTPGSPPTCVPSASPKVGGLNSTCSIVISNISPYKKMEVNLVWTEPGKPASSRISLASYIGP